MQELIIGLGSNIGDRRKAIGTAVKLIGEKIGPVSAISSITETEPWGFESPNKFLNCAIIVKDESGTDPPFTSRLTEIVKLLQSIEFLFGRIKPGFYADREIDLDILFYGNEIINEPGLIVPHPKLHERDFVLNSLKEICPDKLHPVIGKSIREL